MQLGNDVDCSESWSHRWLLIHTAPKEEIVESPTGFNLRVFEPAKDNDGNSTYRYLLTRSLVWVATLLGARGALPRSGGRRSREVVPSRRLRVSGRFGGDLTIEL